MAKISQSLEEKLLDLNGKKIRYLEAGLRQPLILIHGWANSSDFFRDIIPLLAQKFHVLAPDLPGCRLRGKEGSREFDGQHTISAYVEFLRGFTESLNLGKVNLLGVSMGGTIALEWAKKYPKEILKIVSFEPNLGGEELSFLAKSMIIAGRIKFLRPPLRWLYAQGEKREESFKRLKREDQEDLMDELYGSSLRAASESAWDLFKGVDVESYRTIKIPTLLVSGGLKTPVSSPQSVEKLSQIIPGAKVVKFPLAGHALIMEDPAGFAKLVNAFLKST